MTKHVASGYENNYLSKKKKVPLGLYISAATMFQQERLAKSSCLKYNQLTVVLNKPTASQQPAGLPTINFTHHMGVPN
jgi:hypothetical protein